MTKSELIKEIHDKSDYNYSLIQNLVDLLFESLSEGIKNNDKLVISGFGTFEKFYQESHKGVNPSSGKPIIVEGGYKVRFNASKILKNKINEK